MWFVWPGITTRWQCSYSKQTIIRDGWDLKWLAEMQETTCEKRNKTVQLPLYWVQQNIPHVGLGSVEVSEGNCHSQSSLIERRCFTTSDFWHLTITLSGVYCSREIAAIGPDVRGERWVEGNSTCNLTLLSRFLSGACDFGWVTTPEFLHESGQWHDVMRSYSPAIFSMPGRAKQLVFSRMLFC